MFYSKEEVEVNQAELQVGSSDLRKLVTVFRFQMSFCSGFGKIFSSFFPKKNLLRFGSKTNRSLHLPYSFGSESE